MSLPAESKPLPPGGYSYDVPENRRFPTPETIDTLSIGLESLGDWAGAIYMQGVVGNILFGKSNLEMTLSRFVQKPANQP